jgi:hypothetical protein
MKINDTLEKFYAELTRLEGGLGGKQELASANGRMNWPSRGVYYFFEPKECRRLRSQLRVVRVGTHAVSKGSQSSLWSRIKTHKGNADYSGHHRSSVFRLHVGAAILREHSGSLVCPTWGEGSVATKAVRTKEREIEKLVSQFLSKARILVVDINDKPGPLSDRAYIEKNSIALLSIANKYGDSASESWLGNVSESIAIRESGLWNVNHVFDQYDENFVDTLRRYVDVTLGLCDHPKSQLAPPNWKLATQQYSLDLESCE